MQNYKIKLEYDGGRYDGWQRMGNDQTENTISYKIEEVLKKMTGQDIELFCGCRTEKGVHAYGQVANFKIDTDMKDYEIKNYLNRYLPRDIAVLEIEEVDDRFHSQLNAKTKTYVYRIDSKSVANVFERKFMYHAFNKLNVDAMNNAAKSFLGEHDYKAFSTVKKSKSTVKNVTALSIYDDGGTIEISITANDFIHNMARLIVGILIDIGAGKRHIKEISEIFAGVNSQGVSAPAEPQGMFLNEITY